MSSRVLNLTCELIRRPSITPDDQGCQQMLADRLEPLGFNIEWLHSADVVNLIATHGTARPSFYFVGHTDVVPTGPEDEWTSPPFEPTVRGDLLYGRGAADMKGSVAAFCRALEEFVKQYPDHRGSVGLLLTSDEEGVATDGIVKVAEMLSDSGRVPDYCLVGEPSCLETLGDNLRIGRRGSISCRMRVRGIQGHSAYPNRVDNPLHKLGGFMQALVAETWDSGSEHFPPTHCQITNVHAGTGATNVTPGLADVVFNIRYGPASTADSIQERVREMLADAELHKAELVWEPSGKPFLTESGPLVNATRNAVRNVLDIDPRLDTGGGTSDGRFLAPLGADVVELGPINDSIHKIDEHVRVADLDLLYACYFEVLRGVMLEV